MSSSYVSLPIFCVTKPFKVWQFKFKGLRFELAQACTNQAPVTEKYNFKSAI